MEIGSGGAGLGLVVGDERRERADTVIGFRASEAGGETFVGDEAGSARGMVVVVVVVLRAGVGAVLRFLAVALVGEAAVSDGIWESSGLGFASRFRFLGVLLVGFSSLAVVPLLSLLPLVKRFLKALPIPPNLFPAASISAAAWVACS